MIRQQQALIATEGVELIFTDAAIRKISHVAEEVNTLVDNIGARRLHTILECILEDVSFSAPEQVLHYPALILFMGCCTMQVHDTWNEVIVSMIGCAVMLEPV